MASHKPLTNTIKWTKFSKTNDVYCLARDVVITGRGCCLMFVELNSLKIKIYGANNAVNGEGVSCFTGHKTLSIFAFAERCTQPRILVRHYPSFEKISDLVGECIEGYSTLTFSESDFLISLGNFPLFTLVIWNWRKGEMVSKMMTGITATYQMIRCSLTSPVVVAQLGINTTSLKLWTLYTCGKKFLFRGNEVQVTRLTTPFSAIFWHSDGTLFILDIKGDVYTVNSDYMLQKIITWPFPKENFLTCFTWYKNGILISGSNGKIIHFKKQTVWTNVAEINTEEPMKRLITSIKDTLIGVTTQQNIVVFNPEEEKFNLLREQESKFCDVCLVYPVGEFFVTLSHGKFFTVWEVATGKLRSTIEFENEALAIAENPLFPYIGVAFQNGIYQMISVYNPDQPTAITSVQLTRKSLNKIFFTKNGKMTAVGDTTTGEIFVLEGYPGININVEAYVQVGHPFCNFILVPSRTCLRLFVLLITSNNYRAGNKIRRFCVIKGKKEPAVKEFELEESIWYKQLYPTDRENRDRVFYAMPFDSKFLYELETRRGDSLIRITNKINLGHQLKIIKLKFYNEYMISYGYDGLVIVRTTDDLQPLCVVMSHHRKDGGVKKAYISPSLSCLITLGRDNILCCTNLNNVPHDTEKVNELRELLMSPKFLLMFVKSKFALLPIEYPDKTWIEAQALILIEEEKRICGEERRAIMSEFKTIQAEVRKLLHANLNGPENEKIPINYFDMDEYQTIMKSRVYDDICKQTLEELELLIEAQDRVSKYLKTNFWDKMSIKGKAIWGIFTKVCVENYPMIPPDPHLTFLVQCIEEYRKIEESISTGQFLAWLPKSKSQLDLLFQEEPYIKDEKDTFLETLKEEEEEEHEEEDLETMTAFAGSLTHTFIEKSPYHYSQEQIHSYIQIEYETLLSLYENGRLKENFNKQFDGLVSQKEREMKLIKDRNDRLRYILAELNFFNIEKWGLEPINISPRDPQWHPTEQPETIMTVSDKEVPISPYVSPSQQALLAAKAAEEERIRLALLADDFKERALMKMMNGVLEMRWEDEIKNDIPKPKCMVEKIPEEYNEDDLRAVRDYEEKVRQLVADREYYKLLLENEYSKICNTLREGIRKFNGRLDDFLLIKIKVETAILQERLKADMIRKRSLKKLTLSEEEVKIQKMIMENEKEIDEILRKIPIITESLQECRNEIEAITAKDKILEKNFKKDFQDASPVVSEQANKQIKRRPKTNIRNITSSTILLELARCIAINQRSLLLNLNQDSLEFMKALDNIDSYVGIPSAVDESVYAKICQHRRLRIENELRVRANALDVAEAEGTLQSYKKYLEFRREYGRKLRNDLDKVREKKLETVHDNEILLVLKQGVVELTLTGSRHDFENAILIPKGEVDFVNQIIIKNGRRKLRAMRQNMDHHRAILSMEWEHTRLRMTVQDFKTHLADIEAVNVTKDMQSYLKAMAKGYTPEGTLSFEEEMERLTQSYERMLNDRKDKVNKIQKKIKAIKSENKKLDHQISNVNIDLCEYNYKKDETLEDREKEIINLRMASLIKRAKLVKQLQDYHNRILVLQTELELLRLKTYPTLRYKILS